MVLVQVESNMLMTLVQDSDQAFTLLTQMAQVVTRTLLLMYMSLWHKHLCSIGSHRFRPSDDEAL